MGTINVRVEGVDQVNAELESRLGAKAMSQAVDRSLVKGAQVIKRELEINFDAFKDTGASKNEITISKPMTLAGERTVVIHWSGPKKRYTIIHLNEFGTVKNPRPRGFGAVERALRSGQSAYFRAIKEEIRRAIS